MARCGGEILAGPRDESPPVARGICLTQKTLLYQHSLFHLPVNCLPILSSSKQLPLTFFLSLALCFGHVDELFSFPGSLSCLCVIVLLFYPINLSHINLILRPPTKYQKGKGNFILLHISYISHISFCVQYPS